jgi:hypothetical protein
LPKRVFILDCIPTRKSDPVLENMSAADLHTTSFAARDEATSYTLSRGESIGLTLDTEAGILSAVAASVVLIVVFVSHSINPFC